MVEKETVTGKAAGHRYDATSIKVLGVSRPCASARPCTSARPASGACITSSRKWWTTPSTKPWPATARNQRHHPQRQHRHRRRQRPRHSRRYHATEKKPAAEVVMTVLHAGGKFDSELQSLRRPARRRRLRRQRALRMAGTRNLARRQVYEQSYSAASLNPSSHGPAKRARPARRSLQTRRQIFEKTSTARHLAQRLRELAFLNAGLRITLHDERIDKATNSASTAASSSSSST